MHRRSHNGRSQALHGGPTLTCARPLQREWSASIGAASRACSQGTKPKPRVSIRHQSGASGGVGHDHDGGTQRRGAGPCRGPKMGKAKQKVASDAQRRTSRRRVVRVTLLVGLDVQLSEHLVHISCAGSLWGFRSSFSRAHPLGALRLEWCDCTGLGMVAHADSSPKQAHFGRLHVLLELLWAPCRFWRSKRTGSTLWALCLLQWHLDISGRCVVVVGVVSV